MTYCVAHKIHREAKKIIDTFHDINYFLNYSGKKVFYNLYKEYSSILNFFLFVNISRVKYVSVGT